MQFSPPPGVILVVEKNLNNDNLMIRLCFFVLLLKSLHSHALNLAYCKMFVKPVLEGSSYNLDVCLHSFSGLFILRLNLP